MTYKKRKALEVAFGELEENISNAVKAAIEEGAKMLVEEAKRRCPVRTGKLSDSITYKLQHKGMMAVITAPAENNGVPYGQYVEYDPGKKRKFRRTPFMYPAFDACSDKITKMIQDAIQAGVHK